MKPTEITPLDGKVRRKDATPDRLTQVLVWVAFFLIAALVSLITDIVLWPTTDGPVVQAVGPAPSLPTATATLQPTAPPIAAATEVPNSPTAQPPTPTAVTPPPCVPPPDWGIHVVIEGNTLFSLARRYGTDVDTLMRVNCLNTHTIFIDQRLYVPGPLPTPTLPTPVITYPAEPTTAPTDPVPTNPTQVPTPTPTASFRVDVPDRYVNIVLLGSDKRPGSGAWRTDSMIVVSVDTENVIVRLLSIPRDLWVFIPGHGYNRINTADLWGELAKTGSGPDRVKQTIHYNLGIPIHYYVRVDFEGFIEIIDTVGGIDVDVDCPLPDINLSAGMHHMDGRQALRYARSRKSTNDFDRGRRQRKVLMALWDQALTFDVIPKLPELWRTMANSFETDLPLDQVINLAYVGVQLEPQRILSRAIGPSHTQGWVTSEGAAVLLPRADRIRTLLETFYAPVDINSLDAADQVRLRVMNGSQRQQAAQLATAALRWDGFNVIETGTADRRDYAQTTIFVYNGDMAAAEQVARRLQVPPNAIQDLSGDQDQPDLANSADIEVILGSNYNPCQR
jgi:LCP family protein required for cell wall assembly